MPMRDDEMSGNERSAASLKEVGEYFFVLNSYVVILNVTGMPACPSELATSLSKKDPKATNMPQHACNRHDVAL